MDQADYWSTKVPFLHIVPTKTLILNDLGLIVVSNSLYSNLCGAFHELILRV